MPLSATYWIQKLGLIPHPHGGYYRENYRSTDSIPQDALPGRFDGDRRWGTSIYLLIEGHRPSYLHRLRSDEIWHFYTGSPLALHIILEDGTYSKVLLGNDPDAREQFQNVIRAGSWVGANVQSSHGYSLVGCTVVPGFEYDDMLVAKRDSLLVEFPQHEEIISKLTPTDE